MPDGNEVAGLVAILLAIAACALIGAFQGSFVAFIGVPAFVVTLAGYQIWQGVIQKSIEAEGVIVIQDDDGQQHRQLLLLGDRPAGSSPPSSWAST